MKRFLRLPPRGRSGAWIIALTIALLLAVQPMWPDRVAIAVAGAIALTLLAATRWQLTWLPVAVLALCAVAIRLSVWGREASDVADVTAVAIQTMLHGGDPYGGGYAISRPPGAPFPYGPVALGWYLPFRLQLSVLELLVSIGIMLFLAVQAGRGRPIGLAIYALAPPLVLAAVDGSNDTSAGLFILVAFVLATWRPIAGAVMLAVAVAFKFYAVAWLPAFFVWAGLPALLAFVAASVVAWSPVWAVWGVDSFLRSLSLAQQVHLRTSYWSLAAIWDGIVPGAAPRALETMRYVASGAIAVVGALRVRSLDGVIVVGTLAFAVAQFGGYFGSYVYIGAVAPLLCWRIDDWVRGVLPEAARAYGHAHEARRRRHPRPAAPAKGHPSLPVHHPVPSFGHTPAAVHLPAPAGHATMPHLGLPARSISRRAVGRLERPGA